jgi:hypothetical protein
MIDWVTILLACIAVICLALQIVILASILQYYININTKSKNKTTKIC